MPTGNSVTISPGSLDAEVLVWTLKKPCNEECDADIVDDAEIVAFVTYSVDSLGPDAPFPSTFDWSAAFLRVVFATNLQSSCGVTHQLVEVDLRRGVQFSAPAEQISITLRYPIVALPQGLVQPPLVIRASVGRGGHGCGCPTRTVPDPGAGFVARIPVLAYSALLIAPGPAPGARIQFLTAAGGLLSDVLIQDAGGVGLEVIVPSGAATFSLTGVPAGSAVAFTLAF